MNGSRRGFLRRTSALAALLTGGTAVSAARTHPDWRADAVYREGDRVRYDGDVWEAQWWTKGEKPHVTAAVWARIEADSDDTPPAWNPDGVYQAGSRVVRAGSVWEAQWWTRGDDPTESDPWGPWVAVGAVDDTEGRDGSAAGHPAWSAEEIYLEGDRVVHVGSVWEAQWWTRGDDPTGSDPWGPWVEIGPAETGSESDGEPEEEEGPAETPVERHGRLRVRGTSLVGETGTPVQLTGMSTHGLQWYGWGDCVTEASLDALATDWRADVLRISVDVEGYQGDGYVGNPERMRADCNRIVEAATARGLYVVVDWHVVGNPHDFSELARDFFGKVAAEHAGKDNVVYEICNEPTDVSWAEIRRYADEIVPIIRRHDADGVIVVGTRAWSSLGLSAGASAQEIVDDPVRDDNVMYAFHFYAADHRDHHRNALADAADRLPIFVTEWGSMEYTGDGPSDFESSQAYVDLMREKGISWTNWNYSDDWRTSGVWTEAAPDADVWAAENLTETGKWVRERVRNGT